MHFEKIGRRLPHADDVHATIVRESAQTFSGRRDDIDDIGVEAPQSLDRQIEPIREYRVDMVPKLMP